MAEMLREQRSEYGWCKCSLNCLTIIKYFSFELRWMMPDEFIKNTFNEICWDESLKTENYKSNKIHSKTFTLHKERFIFSSFFLKKRKSAWIDRNILFLKIVSDNISKCGLNKTMSSLLSYFPLANWQFRKSRSI